MRLELVSQNLPPEAKQKPTMTITSPRSTAETSMDGGDAAIFLTLHPDIIHTHILSRLDSSALASAATTCSELHALATHEDLWANLCCCAWPSTSSLSVRHAIRSFPHGSHSFFLDCCTIPRPITSTSDGDWKTNLDRTPKLISAVDLYYRQQLLLSTVVEFETVSDQFRSSTFQVHIDEPGEEVEIGKRYPARKWLYRELEEELRLSWIVIDERRGRAMNLSSQKPVRVERDTTHNGGVEVKFATVIGMKEGSPSEMALFSVQMTWAEVEGGGGKMQVGEGRLGVEDMDGEKLKGGDSLGILQRMLEGKRQSNVGGGREAYELYLEKERERREREARGRERRTGLGYMVLYFLITGLSFWLSFWLLLTYPFAYAATLSIFIWFGPPSTSTLLLDLLVPSLIPYLRDLQLIDPEYF